MHIGIEAQRIFRKKKHGMDIVALEIIRQLQIIDTENQYTIFVAEGSDVCLTETPNFKIKVLKALTYPDWEQVALPLAVKKYKVDLLHCTSNTAPLFCPVPLIITLHDVIYLERISFAGTYYQNFGNVYRRLLIPQLAKKKNTTLVTVSEYEKNQILNRLELKPDKVRVIYNGLNHAAFKNLERNDFDKSRLRNLPDNYIFFLGNHAPKKNLNNVVRSYISYCNRNPTTHIPLVILEADRTYINNLLNQFKASSLDNSIITLGYTPHQYLPYLYKKAQLFLYPSLRESFGLPILEAMAVGTPVVTSNTSAMPEIAGDAAYLVDPTSTDAISQSIENLTSDNQLRSNLITKGLERVMKFSWLNAARQCKELYKEFILA
jgi:glycosyltransferase involved in cell wall biosynthesis